MPRALLLALLIGACAQVSSPQLPADPNSGAPARRPNVVFFVVDDLGWMDLGYAGSAFYDTPNIDALAASGMRFSDAYATCPVCSPSRASLLTGKYPQRLGITDYISSSGGNQPEQWQRNSKLLPAAYADRLEHGEVTLAEAFRAADYATFFAGKWHLGPEGHWPEDQGFDVNRGGLERGGPYGGDKYFSPYGNPRLADGPPGEHLPARLAQEARGFIEDQVRAARPFLCYLSFYSVHTPLMAREDLRLKYEARREGLAQEEVFGTEGARKLRRVQEHAVYAGMVEAMDQAVGVVLEGLRELGLEESTIVVFTSDNGGLSTSEGHPTSNLPLRAGKGWLYEGGVREPTLVRWPGVTPPGSASSAVITGTDFYPTLLEMAGLPARPEQHLDGTSFVAALRGQPTRRGPVYWHYPHYGNQGGSPGAAVRDGDLKLIEFFEDDTVELYDLAQDLGESRNLASSRPDDVARLRASLDAWQRRVGATFPAPNPAYH